MPFVAPFVPVLSDAEPLNLLPVRQETSRTQMNINNIDVNLVIFILTEFKVFTNLIGLAEGHFIL